MKKIFYILIVLNITLGLILFPKETKGQAKVLILIEPTVQRVSPGDSFGVQIKIDPQGQNINGIQFNFEFDPNVVEVDETNPITWGPNPPVDDLFSDPGVVDNENGEISNVLAFPSQLDDNLGDFTFGLDPFTLGTINLIAKSSFSGTQKTYFNLPSDSVVVSESSSSEPLEFNISGNNFVVVSDDTTPPSLPLIEDEGEFTSSSSELSAVWTSTDEESGIEEVYFCISTHPTKCEEGTIVDWRSTSPSQSEVVVKNLSLKNNTTYYFHVKVKNGALIWSEISHSDGIKVDINAPQISDDYKFSGQLVHKNQTIKFFPSDEESGVEKILYCEDENCTPNIVLSSPFQITFNKSQDTILRYQAVDRAGNASLIKEIFVKIRKYDINGNGKVDKYDFSKMMASWGKKGFQIADLNGNNVVDKYDFSILMAHWGENN